MTSTDALKSGIKTAVSTFLTGLFLLVTNIFSALQSASTTGNPPNLGFARGAVYALVLALGFGIANALYRWVQVAGIPILGALFDKLLGQVPKYLPPPQGPVDEIGDDAGVVTDIVWVLIGIAAVLGIVLLAREVFGQGG